MAMWGDGNSANDVPLFSADLVNAGSGNAQKRTKSQSMYQNTTPNAFTNNQTVGMYYFSDADIRAMNPKPGAGPGWYIKKQGTGNRSNRVQWECVVAESAWPPKYSWERAVADFTTLADYDFGTNTAVSGATQIANATDLGTYFQDFRSTEPKPQTRNTENQRYVTFSSANNLVFTGDALELTATMPNGLPVGTTSTTITGAVANSRTFTVANASGINLGQVVSLGAKQMENLWATTTFHIMGPVTQGDTATMIFSFPPALKMNPVMITATAGVSPTSIGVAIDLANQINANPTFQQLGMFAFRPQPNTGAFCVVYRQLSLPDQPEFGDTTVGSLTWGPPFAQLLKTGTLTIERKQNAILCWVTAKSGNEITLNYPITAANNDTLNIMPTVVSYRTDVYSGSSNTIPLEDTTTFTIGQAVQLSFQDNNLRFVTAKTANTIQLNASVGLVDGSPIVSLPAWIAITSLAANNTAVLSFTTVPPSVRAGQQFQRYQTNPNSNIRVLSVNTASSPQTVTLDTPVTFATATPMFFYEPMHSVEIWSKAGYAPGADGNNWIALELEADFPDLADIGAWPAFWIFRNSSDSTGLPPPTGGVNEIDMTDTFHYFNNVTPSACYQPQGGTTVRFASPYWDGSRIKGNNIGRKTRKIQLIWGSNMYYAYIDGVMMVARSFIFDNSARAQVAMNLALGSTATGFNGNGFFPLDFSQFPMKYRLKRMRILGRA